MARKQQHLKNIVEQHGTGLGTRTIVSLIESGLQVEREAEQERRKAEGKETKANPYITDFGKCPRQVWYSLRNVPESEPLTTDSLITFGIGHAVEEWLASLLENLGGEVIREVRVEIPVRDTKVSGRADFLVALPDFHALIELKSINSRAMGFMLRKQQAGRDEHRRQLNGYLRASKLGLLGDKPFNKGFLVYAVRDAVKGEPPVHAFEVPYDPEMAEADLTNLAIIQRMADENQDVARPVGYERNKYPCAYCPFKSTCWDSAAPATAGSL